MNELKIFENPAFGKVRVVEQGGEPWFVANDVCEALDIKNSRDALSRLDEDEKANVGLNDGSQNRRMNIVNEYGLYILVMASRKQEAKEFKRWIAHEVIPAIRKTGGYIAGSENMTDAELMAQAVLVAQATIKKRDARIAELESDTQRMKPKEIFADAVSASNSTMLVGELAKILKQNGVQIGANRLFAWLRDKGYLIKRRGADYNKPTQKSMEMGLFEIKETTIMHSDGHTSVNTTSKLTGKGQMYFVNKFLSKGA